MTTAFVIAALTLAMFARTVGAATWHLGKWDPGIHNTMNAIYWAFCGHRYVYCTAGAQAWNVAGCETGRTWNVWASNGQYRGLFQMGSFARARYGHGRDPWTQAKAAFNYYREAGWSPWECQP